MLPSSLAAFTRLSAALSTPSARSSCRVATTARMSSSSAPVSAPPKPQATSQALSQPPPNETVTTASQAQPPLPLPEPPADGAGHVQLDMSTGSAEAKLDGLGPLVVNQDGTVSRINNWGAMSEIERQNTLRILGKRNKLRLSKLKGEPPEP
ncbi:hypothetical protein BROUX41_006733 [Berkeleyomyces rouxiae]|uniref:uncharacterized protein n=1 Tax=Berkeleyomyces rouxiae TaxID=2035830 RepID=UPI003B795F51